VADDFEWNTTDFTGPAQVEDADDLRLNAVLLRLCGKDKKKFCSGNVTKPVAPLGLHLVLERKQIETPSIVRRVEL